MCIYVLVEHQSTPEALMPFRVLRYMVRIWERYVRVDFAAEEDRKQRAA